MLNNEQLKLIRSLTRVDNKSISKRMLKIVEELGECSEALSPYEEVSGCGYKKRTTSHILEESIDVLLCSLSLLYQVVEEYKFSDKETEVLLNKKLIKWENKVTAPKENSEDDCM
jgi:NTP pyrophosphatase (non-canonical NTP hydrolase)